MLRAAEIRRNHIIGLHRSNPYTRCKRQIESAAESYGPRQIRRFELRAGAQLSQPDARFPDQKVTVRPHTLPLVRILRPDQEIEYFHGLGVVAADVGCDTESLVEVRQGDSAVPAVKVELVR